MTSLVVAVIFAFCLIKSGWHSKWHFPSFYVWHDTSLCCVISPIKNRVNSRLLQESYSCSLYKNFAWHGHNESITWKHLTYSKIKKTHMVKTGKKTASHFIDQMIAMLQKSVSPSGNDSTLLLETHRAWEALMTSCYQEVLELCASECRSIIEESQRNWVKYRDMEYNCLDKIYSFQVSQRNLQTAGNSKNDLIRSRALQLQEYRNMLRKYRGIQSDK